MQLLARERSGDPHQRHICPRTVPLLLLDGASSFPTLPSVVIMLSMTKLYLSIQKQPYNVTLLATVTHIHTVYISALLCL